MEPHQRNRFQLTPEQIQRLMNKKRDFLQIMLQCMKCLRQKIHDKRRLSLSLGAQRHARARAFNARLVTEFLRKSKSPEQYVHWMDLEDSLDGQMRGVKDKLGPQIMDAWRNASTSVCEEKWTPRDGLQSVQSGPEGGGICENMNVKELVAYSQKLDEALSTVKLDWLDSVIYEGPVSADEEMKNCWYEFRKRLAKNDEEFQTYYYICPTPTRSDGAAPVPVVQRVQPVQIRPIPSLQNFDYLNGLLSTSTQISNSSSSSSRTLSSLDLATSVVSDNPADPKTILGLPSVYD